jgi:hypothetical protein
MKKIFTVLFFSLLAHGAAQQQQAPLQQAPPPADAGIEGRIVRWGTGENLSKAVVELRATAGGAIQTTTTETDGRFYFPQTVPGTYRLTSKRDGYWNAEYGQRWIDGPGQVITIAPGAKLRDIQVVMTPGGVIAGRITNRDGLPMAGARVSAMKPWINQNQRQLRPVTQTVANDLGEFRLIWLMPGRYYLSATYVQQGNQPPGQQRQQMGMPGAGGNLVINPDAENGLATGTRTAVRPVTSRPLSDGLAADEVYTSIFYPTTIDSDRAVAIELKQGEEYRGADINVSPVRAFHVRGSVTNLPPPTAAAGPRGGGGVPRFGIALTPTTPNGTIYNTSSDAEGKFDFQKVLAGGYVAYIYQDGMTIRSNVDVRNGDVDGVTLQLATGIDTPVKVSFDGTPPPNFPSLVPSGGNSLSPRLWRNPTLLNAPPMPVNVNSAPLALTNIAPGDYHMYVPPLFGPMVGLNPFNVPAQWQNAYVKSITLGDRDVLNDGWRLERPSDVPIEVVIGANPGSMQGLVLNDQRQPSVGAVITMFHSNPAQRIYRTDMYRVTSTDTSGRFNLGGLRPGEYRVFAWENIESGTWVDSTFLRLHEDKAITVKVEEGKPSTGDLVVIRP